MKRRLLARSASRSRAALVPACMVLIVAACSAKPDAPQGPIASAGTANIPPGAATVAVSATAPPKRRPSAPRRGRQGIGCTVKNDCAMGLSCIQGVCQPSSFGLTPSDKECVQIDCTSSADCCAGLPTRIPDKCRSRASTCLQQLPGCATKACTRSAECAGGGVCVGKCAVSSGECRGNIDCLANKCVEGKCSLDFTVCDSDAQCAPNACTGGSCSCENPSYSPNDPICQDPDCDGLCIWSCEDSRCVIPTSCKADADCFGSKPQCVDGNCVECSLSTDCSFGKICVDGSCETPCQDDEQCALFEACQAGECIYVGCRSDRECALVPDVKAIGLTPGTDPRLLRCHTDQGVGHCLIPCQTDSQCEKTDVCSGGLCKYIGCESTDECATILGVHDQVRSNEHPWVASVECRETK